MDVLSARFERFDPWSWIRRSFEHVQKISGFLDCIKYLDLIIIVKNVKEKKIAIVAAGVIVAHSTYVIKK